MKHLFHFKIFLKHFYQKLLTSVDSEVKERRLKAGLTQQELSEKTGIPRGRINAWEQRGTVPRADDYALLMKVFKETKVSKKDKILNLILEEPEADYSILIKVKSTYVQRFTSLH
jgi:transcriptional regulator with XRE-family HTH domain